MAFERILTTHTGSLPRPPALLRSYDADEHDERVALAVRDCVLAQIEAGIDLVSDGEMGKPSYATYVKDRLLGFGGRGPLPSPADLDEYPGYARRVYADPGLAELEAPFCLGPVAYRGKPDALRDTQNLRRAIAHAGRRASGFLTAASPGVIALFLENRYYASEDEYLDAIATAMREEYLTIHASGLVLQLDAPDLAMARHMTFAGASVERFRRSVSRNLALIDAATQGIPPECLRLHVCWGNYEGPHHRDVPLEQIADLLVTARPSVISFPAANPRHEHEWRVWERVRLPDDKVIVPGVIDSTTNFVEHPELVAERILRFARVVGAERVIAGTDCGFGTFAGLGTVEPAIVWAKLAALSEGARLATRALRRDLASSARPSQRSLST